MREGFEERGRWQGRVGQGRELGCQGQADCSLGGGPRRRLELNCEGGEMVGRGGMPRMLDARALGLWIFAGSVAGASGDEVESGRRGRW